MKILIFAGLFYCCKQPIWRKQRLIEFGFKELLYYLVSMANEVLKKKKKKSIDKYIDRFPSKLGSQGYDPWGFNIEGVRTFLGSVKFLYESFFRVEAFGLENIPPKGRALIISNHSGQLPLDGALIGYALLTNDHAPRAPKAMIERFLPTVPFVGNMLNSLGAVLGSPKNCERMLNADEAIIVFPEGVRGSNKVFNKRYQLQRFGNGFMHLAMKNNAPIIPVGVVGCEESIVSLADIKPLAKLLGMPVFPLVIPMIFPTKVYIHFGEPMYFENDVHREEEIKERVDLVKKEIDQLIQKGLSMRKSVLG